MRPRHATLAPGSRRSVSGEALWAASTRGCRPTVDTTAAGHPAGHRRIPHPAGKRVGAAAADSAAAMAPGARCRLGVDNDGSRTSDET